MGVLLTALCRANHGLLKQKKDLIRVLELKHGFDELFDIYQMPCSIVNASMGQHIRHSMDHIERAAMAASAHTNDDFKLSKDHGYTKSYIHYDIRDRNTNDEKDFMLAVARIDHVGALLDQISTSPHYPNQLVHACFMLSGDSPSEFRLPSTIGRELGFAAHHAIHHLAMVRIIALDPNVGGLKPEDLPPHFGKAPSTIHYDESQEKL